MCGLFQERCINAGTLTVNFEKVPVDYKLKHNDLLANIVHRSASSEGVGVKCVISLLRINTMLNAHCAGKLKIGKELFKIGDINIQYILQ